MKFTLICDESGTAERYLVVGGLTVPRTNHLALAAELQDHARVHCAAHSYPREVVFLDALPMTVTGKVMRRELRKLAAGA